MIDLQTLKRVYGSSPLPLQRAYAAIPWSLRMGATYRRTLQFLTKSQNWTKSEWQEFQSERLRHLMEYCGKHVPHYRSSFEARSIDAQASDIWREFAKLPLIDKSVVMADPRSFLSDAVRASKSFSATTGGTTGKPLKVVYDRATYAVEWAFKVYSWGLAVGYTPAARKATFRHFDAARGYCQANPIYNEMRFSPYHLTPETMPEIIGALKDYAPQYLHGYPSALDVVAKFCLAEGISLPDVKGAILISENILPGQADRIAQAFGEKAYSFYGHAERVIFASMGPGLADYYAHPAYGVTEIVDETGQRINEPGVPGELVGSGFINAAMPLLRYRTGDYSAWSKSKVDPAAKATSDAHLDMPALSEIKGRWRQEHLVGSGGKQVSLTSLNLHADVYARLKHFQYVQNEIGKVLVNIVPEPTFSSDDAEMLTTLLERRLGEEFDIALAIVDAPQRTPAGKLQFLIQDLSPDLDRPGIGAALK